MRFTLLLLITSVLLPGCGFQLRGQANLPPELSRIFIESSQAGRGPGSPLVRRLSSSLVANGVTLVDNSTAADAVLRILDEGINRRTLGAGSTGDSREYSLDYSVRYTLVDSANNTLVEADTLRYTRDVLYSEADVLGRSEGEDIVLEDMINDAAYSIIRRLEIFARAG